MKLSGQRDFLPPDEAFRLNPLTGPNGELVLEFANREMAGVELLESLSQSFRIAAGGQPGHHRRQSRHVRRVE